MSLTYEQFKAAVTPAHITLLTLIAHKQEIRMSDPVQIADMRATMEQLLTNRMVKQAREIWEWQGDVLLRGFDAILEPVAVTYMTQLMLDAIPLLQGQAP